MEHISEELKKRRPKSSKRASAPAPPSASEEICRLCHGAGVLHPLKEDGKPDYGRVVNCPCMEDEIKRRTAENLLRYCQLPAGTGHMTLESFKVDAGNREAYQAAAGIAQESGLKWLTMLGGVDRGKTHLAIGICREWIKKGRPARYAYVPLLLEELRRGFGREGDEGYERKFDFFCRVSLLVLDDLGVQKTTDFAMEKLNTIIDYRYMNALPLVVTMNKRIDDIPGDDESRIASRLRRFGEGKVVVLEGEEYRLRKNK